MTTENYHCRPDSEQPINERDGNWLDKWGCCKVCDGEIPYGHTDNCDIYKLEQKVRNLEAENGRLHTRVEEAESANREMGWSLEKIARHFKFIGTSEELADYIEQNL